ncbi:NAD(P)H-dependent oxidoreductase [Bacillus cereus]
MNILIVYAHPNSSSLNAAILKHEKTGLKEMEYSVTVLGLYKEYFSSVLTFDESKERGMVIKNV